MDLTVAVHFLEYAEENEQVPRRRLRDSSNVLEIPTNQFTGNLRISKEIFVLLLEMLQDKWAPAFRSTHIRPDIKLATFVRFLATGSYQQSVGNECVSSTAQSSVGRIINECLQLFEKWICPQWIKMPRPEEEGQIMEGFFNLCGFPGVIGCVDGTHIRIKSPGDDVKRLYYNRKGYYSINAMVVCDHKMSVMFVDARHPGANHDSFIWEQCVVDRKMQNEFDSGKRNAWILGDGGYKLKPYLMTPFRSPKDAAERRFNMKQASTRNVVERCFGVMKNRFRCILGSRGLHYSPEKVTTIVNACSALHNMCIKYKCVEVTIGAPESIEESFIDDSSLIEETAVAIRRNIAINL